MVAGVAGGIAQYVAVDPVVVRIIFVALALFGGGGILLYLICWLLMPEES
jgi:phage shock protein C